MEGSSQDIFPLSTYSQPFAIAVLIRGILYGVYVATFAHSCYLLVYRNHIQNPRNRFDKKLLSITIFIFVFLTMSLGVTFQILLNLLQDNKRSAILSIVKIFIENTMVLITNAVLIYRCWIVYTNSCPWTTIFVPLFLWISTLTCSILIVYHYALVYRTLLPTTPDASVLFSREVPESVPYWVVFYVFDIVINIYVTYGIIHRIRACSHVPGSRQLYTISKILAQFCCLYITTTSLSLISVIVDHNNVHDVAILDTMRFALDSINLMIPGITFNIIQIFVHRQRAKVESSIRMRSGVRTLPSSPYNHFREVSVLDEMGVSEY
ncbi:hypothetical protein M378DRAFT_26896 [Amanita muscaria Koide BX008]|uniref:Uncharacterized protein n=1 Tax=Amanita muscaria (strain Koide BX008) TaxID=946122 RepID=A0A0C2WE46_AMAMK|nr:hypothetical protein M378DRAFT_26896 [Amanita muscaria Koide BX008]